MLTIYYRLTIYYTKPDTEFIICSARLSHEFSTSNAPGLMRREGAQGAQGAQGGRARTRNLFKIPGLVNVYITMERSTTFIGRLWKDPPLL